MDNKISFNNINGVFFNSETDNKTNTNTEISMFPFNKLKEKIEQIRSPQEEYSIDNLKNMYPSNEFYIENKDGNYIVTRKDNNSKAFSVEFNEDKTATISKFNKDGLCIEEIVKNQYGIMTQKRTIDPYDIGTKQLLEYDDSGILIRTSDFYISYNGDVGMKAVKITTYKNGKPYKIETSDPDIPVKFPLAETIKSKFTNNDPTVVGDILQITPDTVVDIVQNYYSINTKEDWLNTINIPLIKTIEESLLSEAQKKKAISHLEKTIETAAKQNGIPVPKTGFDYDKAVNILAYKQEGVDLNFTIPETQVNNPYYAGDKYSLKQDGMIITITNKDTNTSNTIDLEKLLEKYVNIQEKAKIIELIQKVPPEVLMDLSYEIENFRPPLDALDIYKDNALGYYYPTTNEIAVNVMTDIDTFVHEMGHAVDHIGKDVGGGSLVVEFSTDNNEKFTKIFEAEMEKYINAGNKRYDYEDPTRDICTYATTNPQEMFAECYDLLMRGDSGSKDVILKYFPETLEFIKEQIAFNRKQSAYARLQ